MLEVAHVVTVTTPALAELYRSWGGDEIHVLDELPAAELRDAHAHAPTRRRASSSAGPRRRSIATTSKRSSCAQVFSNLIERHPDLHVVTIGIDLDLQHERCERRPISQYPDLSSHIADFDIGIAPIADIPFNRTRSRVKVKEYAGAGVPWLASPIGPYAGLGEDQGGRLVADDAWGSRAGTTDREPEGSPQAREEGGEVGAATDGRRQHRAARTAVAASGRAGPDRDEGGRMRIALIVPDGDPNPQYRGIIPMDELAKHGHVVGTAVSPQWTEFPPLESFEGLDVVYFWRMFYTQIRHLTRALRRDGHRGQYGTTTSTWPRCRPTSPATERSAARRARRTCCRCRR